MSDFDCLFLGTGTSSCLPVISCLVSETGCYSCKSTLTSDGKENIRRNVSAILRIPDKTKSNSTEVSEKTILIDCGKSFYSGVMEHWVKQGLRQIDALILTHAHSDAMLGLDDLRGWTLGGAIQKSIDIYASKNTFEQVSQAFPYLVDAKHATGGGDIPQFNWIVFPDTEPFVVHGVTVTPLPVHHGRYFDVRGEQPYLCHGFLFNNELLYLSDVSYIPPNVWDQIKNHVQIRDLETKQIINPEKPKLKAFVCDSLKLEPHTSHFGFPQAYEAIQQINAQRSYLVGFAHRTSQALWRHVCETLSDSAAYQSTKEASRQWPEYSPSHITPDRPPYYKVFTGSEDPTKEDPDAFLDIALNHVVAWLGHPLENFPWVRPAVDGLTIKMASADDKRSISDDYYIGTWQRNGNVYKRLA